MKKEVKVKSYKRRLKSGKTIIVKAHTAKRDVDMPQKPGAGEEYIVSSIGAKTSLDNIPYSVQTFSDEAFKEWYKFNEWDAPRNKWPKAVREVDDRLRQCMTKKNYDKYCAMIDESWFARGAMLALRKYSSYCKDGSPAQAKSKINRSSTAVPKVNKDIDGDWSGHEYYLQKKQSEPKKQVIGKSSSEDYYTKQTRHLMSEVKNAVERANKNMISGWSSNFYAPSYKELQSFVHKIKGTLPKGINVKIRKYSDYKEGSRGSYGNIIVETDPNIITGSYDIDYNK